MNVELKVKLLTLGAESRIIKQQERQWLARARRGRDRHNLAQIQGRSKDVVASLLLGLNKAENQFLSLRLHRLKDVRQEARSTNLAYGFLRGRSYEQIEAASYAAPDWDRIEEIARKFDNIKKGDNYASFANWKTIAENWLQGVEASRQAGETPDRRKPRLTKRPEPPISV